MDKGSLVNVDLQPVADVVNNLINKLANVAGWIVTPKGEKAQEIEAQKYLIEQIKNDENMPLLFKTALISNASKLIKEYTNQNDIVQMAFSQLSENSNPGGVSDEWILDFMGYCKNVSNEDVKSIWAKILAEECNNNGAVSKRLLNILSLMDKNEAAMFNKLIQFQIRTGDTYETGTPLLFIYGNPVLNYFFESNELSDMNVKQLETIGLVQSDKLAGFSLDNLCGSEKKRVFSYFDTIIEVTPGRKEMPIGMVVFTPEGESLARILHVNKVKGFVEHIVKYYENRGYIVNMKSVQE